MSSAAQDPMVRAPLVVILRILNVIARCDGFISSEEEKILDKLINRYKIDGEAIDGPAYGKSGDEIKQLASLLEDEKDQLIALRLAYMVASISKNIEDNDFINVEEREVYEQLKSSFNFTAEHVTAIEQEARKELETKDSFWEVLFTFFAENDKSWPGYAVIGAQVPGLFI